MHCLQCTHFLTGYFTLYFLSKNPCKYIFLSYTTLQCILYNAHIFELLSYINLPFFAHRSHLYHVPRYEILSHSNKINIWTNNSGECESKQIQSLDKQDKLEGLIANNMGLILSLSKIYLVLKLLEKIYIYIRKNK